VSDLGTYHSKRDPKRTPEPFGGRAAARATTPNAWRDLVVQQHAARRLHWDVRLEIDGVLASWAVPRGPSLDPTDRRLAVRTEDHPMEYADFEGVIPKGNYGAGAMIVWDRGRYRTVDGQSPAEGLAAGKLDLEIAAEKLRGRFALVRTKGEDGRQWLLLYKGRAGVDVVATSPASVLSGLTVEEIGDRVRRDDEIAALVRDAGAPERDLDVVSLRPMLARTQARAFSDPAWVFELKYDGARVLAARRDAEVRLIARSGRDVTEIYPEVTSAIAHLPLSSFVLDGEIAALGADGRSSFERLQHRFTLNDPSAVASARLEYPVVLYAFDLLAAAGHDLCALPLVTRKSFLSRFVPPSGIARFADHVVGDGLALYEEASRHRLEGIVAKRAQSVYEVGERSDSWRKIKLPRATRLVVVGYLPGRGARGRLGSLMLAGYRDGELVYAVNVGSGLRDDDIAWHGAALDAHRVPKPRFSGGPEPPVKGSVYTQPELVCEVRFTELTTAGVLRQPVFLRRVPDAAPEDCSHPGAALLAAVEAEPAAVPAKPQAARAAAALTRAVWPWLAPYLRDRPVVLTRYPDGIEGKSFFQKNAPEWSPSWARHVEIEGTDYFVCNELRTLLHVINSGAIPLHVWSARLPSLDRPDWLILDLDPKEAPFEHVVRIARSAHALLDELGTPHFVKTSGQAGLHVLVPLGATIDHDDARDLGEVLARVLQTELPEIATIARPLASRGDRVYLDYLQNGRGKLIAAPFSVRPRPGAPVSLPLDWARVNRRLDPSRFTIKTAIAELERHGDPLADVLAEPIDVAEFLSALAERLEH
jgi:bifunctional non-homologous end joining protein LigD